MRPSYLRPRHRGSYKERAACPITKIKGSNSSHFHIPLIFCPALLSQPCSIRGYFSLFDTFSHLRNLKNTFSLESLYHKDSNMFRPLNKVKPCSPRLLLTYIWMGDQKYSLSKYVTKLNKNMKCLHGPIGHIQYINILTCIGSEAFG